jgi:hypothetical protein
MRRFWNDVCEEMTVSYAVEEGFLKVMADSKKGWCPTGAQGSPIKFFRLMEELNPEPFDRRKFWVKATRQTDREIILNLGAQVLENPVQNLCHKLAAWLSNGIKKLKRY